SVQGEDVTRLSLEERARWRRQKVGVVLQRDSLHPLLDVDANVELPLRLDGRRPDAIVTRVTELLELVGLSDRRSYRVRQLSGGEAQRGALPVALAGGPSVLLADEPTGELDEATASGILDLTDELVRSAGTAV